jgi:peptide/nickel transport system ATP-binding protein
MAERLLEIKGLKTHFFTEEGVVRAVDGVDLHIDKGETLGVVGESGCGKTVTALSVMKLIPMPPGKIVEGQMLYEGRDLVTLPPAQMRKVRGKEISMVFQEPMTSLNPVFTIGEQIAEAIRLHEGLGRRAAMDKTVEMLKIVHIPNPERRVKEYPHQLSGGMRQRVMIAMALSCNPKLLIADEPTTALDVTIQAQILELLNELKSKLGMAVLLITHDMGVIAETAQRVMVMYAGKVVEEASVKELFKEPLHPYTQGLLRSIPPVDPGEPHRRDPEEAAGGDPRRGPEPPQPPQGMQLRTPLSARQAGLQGAGAHAQRGQARAPGIVLALLRRGHRDGRAAAARQEPGQALSDQGRPLLAGSGAGPRRRRHRPRDQCR